MAGAPAVQQAWRAAGAGPRPSGRVGERGAQPGVLVDQAVHGEELVGELRGVRRRVARRADDRPHPELLEGVGEVARRRPAPAHALGDQVEGGR